MSVDVSVEAAGDAVQRAIWDSFCDVPDTNGNVFTALDRIADALRALGNDETGTPAGALGELGASIESAAEIVAGGLRAVAVAIEKARS